MNLITRSEASFRMKNIGAKVSQCVTACRDGDWKLAHSLAYDADQMLHAMLKHLSEAADNALEVVIEPEPPAPEYKGGGMGYRGSHSHSSSIPVADVTPPAPISGARRPPKNNTAPPKPIITPPPPSVVITPPPAPKVEAKVFTFDLPRIFGTDEYFARGFNDTPLTEAECEASDIFQRMSSGIRRNIEQACRVLGKPLQLQRNENDEWSVYDAGN